MKNRNPFPHLIPSGLALALGVTFAVSTARAVPYASGITNDAGTIRFILNEAADNVKVVFNGGASTNDLGARAKGVHSFALGGASSWEIHVTRNTTPSWTLTSDDLNPLVRFYGPRGIAVYRDPSDLSRFGRIYVLDTVGGTITAAPVESARQTSKGVYILNADQSDALGYGDWAQDAGIFFGGNAVSPFRIDMGEDGMIYIGDWYNPNTTIFRCDADVTYGSGETVLEGIGNTANPTVHTAINGSAIAKGSTNGGNLTVWAIDGQWTGTGGYNCLLRWDIGSGPLPHNTPPTPLGTAGNSTAADVHSDLDIAPDGKFFVMQYRDWGAPQYVYNSGRVNIRVYDTDGTTLLWDSFLESQLAGLTNATSGDVFRLARAIKVSPDGKRVAVIRNDTQTWIMNLTNGVPDISTRLLLNGFGSTAGTSNGREVSWDAAGNLYVASSSQEKLRVWSPGGSTTAITRSAGTFEVATPGTEASIAATIVTAYEADSVNGQFTISRSGNTSGTTTVGLTVTGTATSGADYTELPAAVTFAAGQTTTNLAVAVVDDNVAEFTETVIVTLSPGVGYNITTPSATVAIVDNETPELTVNITQTNLLEAFAGGRVTCQLTRRGQTNAALTANIAYTGTAAHGTDFAGPLTVSIGAGAVNVNYNLTPIDDFLVEGAETIIATVVAGTGYVVGSPASVTAFIIDDDLPASTVLFLDRFDTDTSANWVVNKSDFGTDSQALFGYNYSADSIPEAPSSSGPFTPTCGLKFRVNEFSGFLIGLSASPLNQSFTGDYRLRFDMWLNFNGPLAVGGTGSTEHLSAGVGTSGLETIWPDNASQGVWFTASSDGQVGDTETIRADYGVLIGTALQDPSTGCYTAGTALGARGNNDPHYNVWGGLTAPAGQLATNPSQTGTTGIGSMGMAWHTVTITKQGTNVTWDIDGRRIATVDITGQALGDNVFVGYHDWYISVATNTAVQFGLVDNVRVEDLVPVAPPSRPNITLIRIVGGNVEIDFTADLADTPSSFVLQESSMVIPGSAYADVISGTTITGSSGNFKAERAAGTAPKFYRIRRN